MTCDAILALDLGTTSCRALLFDVHARVLGRAEESYPLLRRHPGWAEHHPEGLVTSSARVIRGALTRAGLAPSRVSAVSLSTYLHSLLATDRSGRPVSPVITWADTRSAAEADELRAIGIELYLRTGCPPHPMYPLAKLLWVRKHQPELCASAPLWGSIKDLLMRRLTGEWAVDHSIASGSGMLELARLDWDEDALMLAGITRHQLPELLPTTAALPLDRAGAELTGLTEGTPVVVGAGDGPLSNLGAGAVGPGMMAIMVGTSGAVRVASSAPRTDPQGRTWCYNLTRDCWLIGGAISNGGIVLEWLRDRWLPPGKTYGETISAAGRVPLGAGGLLFLPLLAGERSPYWNSRARGVVVGLGLEHGPEHLTRAALEGVTFQLNSVRRAVEELVGPAVEVRATGGFTRSAAWVQMCADVFGRAVNVCVESEGSALGAFLLARYALNAEVDLATAASKLAVVERAYTPHSERQLRYSRLYDIYLDTYRHLQDTFGTLAEFRAAAK